MYDASYRCVVGKGGRNVGARIIDWDGISGCFGGWYVALGASFHSDVYGLSCCECGVLGQPCTFCRFSKQVVMSGCFVDERSCSGVGPGGRVSRVLANGPSHRAAKNVDRRVGLDSMNVRERICSGECACRSLRRWKIAFWKVLGSFHRWWGFTHKISSSESR